MQRQLQHLFVILLVLAIGVLPCARDLTAQGSAVIGRVLQEGNERPVFDATVELLSLGQIVRSDSLGQFHFRSLKPGSYALQVRAVGYAPVTMQIRLAAQDTVDTDVLLAPTAQRLGTVRTDSSMPEVHRRFLREFDERRKLGMGGRFLDAEFFKKNDTREVRAILESTIPNIRIVRKAGLDFLIGARGAGWKKECFVQIVVNGFVQPEPGVMPYDLIGHFGQNVLAFEYHGVGSTPMQYNATGRDNQGVVCGTAIFWTR
ncbi:MAG: carboxypeptidase-like regulatory domain-containing protein [Gemmatimonadaceae bacterium]|nr:carboxypeptidase-like regulatory domain-containing protein [Gemmatimonadaceae bacterium]